MSDDIVRNKTAIIRRCVARIAEEYQGNPARLDDFTIQDAIVLNLLRACEAAIDLAMHHVAENKLGVPQSSRDAFRLIENSGALSAGTARALSNMVGFRNIAVHAYQELQRPILEAILDRHLPDFERFIKELKN
ncbi:DUF86 domain-containing protein [Haloferula sp. A504]|uniref:type VII toxin-antitoxin system HepT family RNase toxin n=1 Tax=Haloferula sp. A504 TaxID=3373601 RepID=UPI0031CC0B0A|nr:DUF86 domain-containing protein [Verrucomicrobiaceae bacterium E54]